MLTLTSIQNLPLFLAQIGSPGGEGVLDGVIAVALTIILALVAYLVTRTVLLRFVVRAISRARANWGEILLERGVFHLLSLLAPALVIGVAGPFVLEGYDRWIALIGSMTSASVIVISALVVNAGLNAALDIYEAFELSRSVPLTSFAQAAKIVVFSIAGFLVISLVLNIPLVVLLSALAALIATFRDPILGLVAGIQIAANKMVSIGDWIEMPEFGVDGEVLEIHLTTVKVRNFDNTITTIPPHTLVSQPVKSWQAMRRSRGRRIKETIYIDIYSIRPCTKGMLAEFSQIGYVADCIAQKKDGEHVTNIGVFRDHVTAYLQSHPLINPDLALTVRLLAPTAHGVPVEIYAFSREKAMVWSTMTRFSRPSLIIF
jgi:miniconductance mechanosensitive channel